MPTPQLFSTPTPVPEAIARVLVEAGIDTVFGIPGGETDRPPAPTHRHSMDELRSTVRIFNALETASPSSPSCSTTRRSAGS